MKKLFFIWLFFSCPVWALVAPRMYMADSSCPKNAPFREGQWNYENRDGGYYTPYGKCISCDTTRALMLVNEKDCDLCPNRTVYKEDTLGGWIQTNYCRLRTCPPEKPFFDNNWNWSGCTSCQDEPKHIKKEECEQCSNMRWVEGAGCAPDKSDRIYYTGTMLSPDGREMSLDGGSPPFDIDCENERWQRCEAIKTSEQECKKCSFTYMKDGFCHMDGWKKVKDCPEGYIRSVCGFCIPCSEVNGDKLSEKECIKCPYHVFNNGHCNRNGSPDPNLLLVAHENGDNGKVRESYHSCDTEERISTTKEYCDKCPNRIYVKDFCILKECPVGKVMGLYYECTDCKDILYYRPIINQEECSRCSNLIFKDGQCLYKISQDPERRLVYTFEDSRWLEKDASEGWRDVWLWNQTNCNEPDAVKTMKEYCGVCPNREYVDGKCILKNK